FLEETPTRIRAWVCEGHVKGQGTAIVGTRDQESEGVTGVHRDAERPKVEPGEPLVREICGVEGHGEVGKEDGAAERRRWQAARRVEDLQADAALVQDRLSPYPEGYRGGGVTR